MKFIIRIPVEVLSDETGNRMHCDDCLIEVNAKSPEQAVEKLAESLRVRAPVKRPPATPHAPLRGGWETPGHKALCRCRECDPSQ